MCCHLEKFCFCLPLKIGAIAAFILSVLISIFSICQAVDWIIHSDRLTSWQLVLVSLFIIFAIIFIASTICLLLSIIKNKPIWLGVWLNCCLGHIINCLMAAVLLMVEEEYYWAIAYICCAVILAYFYVIVLNYRRSLYAEMMLARRTNATPGWSAA